MSKYILINQAFAQAHTGYKRDHLEFGYAITKDGRYVCSDNSRTEFPELFENDTLVPLSIEITLTVSDFPTQQLP